MADRGNPKAPLDILGSSGLKQVGGFVMEEPLPELSFFQRMAVYKLMRENDSTVGSVMLAVEMLIRSGAWQWNPASDDNADHQAAEFAEQCWQDMSMTPEDTVSEVSTFLQFGWAWHAIVYKLRRGNNQPAQYRSRFDDGLVGWRKLPGRAQETLWNWEFDTDGGVKAMVQYDPYQKSVADVMPIERSLLFRTSVAKGNPEGRSTLRAAYRPWLFKRRIEEIEGIGVERDLAGLPMLIAPEDMNLWDVSNPTMVSLKAAAESMVSSIRRDEMEGVVIPFGWELSLLSTGGRRQIDVGAVIERYERRIAMTILADVIMMGHEKVGSFALADAKTNLLAVAINAWRHMIADVINRYAIPRLFELNPSFVPSKSGKYPTLVPVEQSTPDLAAMGAFIRDTTGSGVLLPSPEDDAWARKMIGMPERPDDAMAAFVEQRINQELDRRAGEAQQQQRLAEQADARTQNRDGGL